MYAPNEDYNDCMQTPDGVFATDTECRRCLSSYRNCTDKIAKQCNDCTEYCSKECDPHRLLHGNYCQHICSPDDPECEEDCVSTLLQSEQPCQDACHLNCQNDCATYTDSRCKVNSCNIPVCRRQCDTKDELNSFLPASSRTLLLKQPSYQCSESNSQCVDYDDNILQWYYRQNDDWSNYNANEPRTDERPWSILEQWSYFG